MKLSKKWRLHRSGKYVMEDAEIIPLTVGREKITKVFGNMIRDSITGSRFKSTQLWGNEHLLVEDGTGSWYHANGTPVGSGRYLLVWQKDDGNGKSYPTLGSLTKRNS